jgi:hypothetical protein
MQTDKDKTVTLASIRFAEAESAGETVLLRFADPSPTIAAVKRVPAAGAIPAADSRDDLTVVMIAAEIANRKARLDQARQWLKSQEGPPAVRISLEETGWILFRPGVAVIAAPAEEMDGLLEAVVDFAYHERELRALETEAAANWHTAQSHLSLIHTMNEKEFRKSKDVGPATQSAMLRRMRYARLEPHLTLVPDHYKGAAREAALRLRQRPSMEARLEAIDGQIECYEDIYDMANQRRGEYENFIKGFHIEVLILMVLFLELCMMGLEFYYEYLRAE